MTFEPTGLPGAYLVRQTVHADERGSFSRLFCADAFASTGIDFAVCQSSLSRNPRKRTLRGMHYQIAPGEEDKLVSCVGGRIFDAIVDLRPQSETFGKWYGVELDPSASLFIPRGFAHGFVTLEDETSVLYQISAPYAPELAAGLRWDDPTVAIGWPVEPEIVSDRDRNFPLIEQIRT